MRFVSFMYPPAPVCLSPKNRSCSLFSGMKCTRGLYRRHEFPVKSRQNRRGKILPLAEGIIRPARKFLPRGAGIRIRGIDRPGPGRIERLPCGRSARLPVFGAVLREPGGGSAANPARSERKQRQRLLPGVRFPKGARNSCAFFFIRRRLSPHGRRGLPNTGISSCAVTT